MEIIIIDGGGGGGPLFKFFHNFHEQPSLRCIKKYTAPYLGFSPLILLFFCV
jgi:hypothetical protein